MSSTEYLALVSSSGARIILSLLHTLKSQDLPPTTIVIFSSFSSMLRKFLKLLFHIPGIIFCKIFSFTQLGFNSATTFGISLHPNFSQLLLADPVSWQGGLLHDSLLLLIE